LRKKRDPQKKTKKKRTEKNRQKRERGSLLASSRKEGKKGKRFQGQCMDNRFHHAEASPQKGKRQTIGKKKRK